MMTPTRIALAAAAATLGLTGTADAAAPEPSPTVLGTYQINTKRICVAADLLQPSERAKIGSARRPCLNRASWSALGIDFTRPAAPVRGAAS